MKSIRLTLTVLIFAVPALSFAGSTLEFDEDALSLLTDVFTYCPIQFIQAMKGATNVGRATYTYDDAIHYTITTVNRAPFPGYDVRDVTTLNIHRVSVKSDPDEDRDTADGPPPEWITTCDLVTH